MSEETKTAWPPVPMPEGGDDDANVFPRVSIASEMVSEVEHGTGVFNTQIIVKVESKFIHGFAFMPDGTCDISCTDRAPVGGTSTTIENGHIAHSELTGNMTNHFFENQSAWIDGIQGSGRGVKVLKLRWAGEPQDVIDGIMTTEIKFNAISYWDGTNAISSDVPEGDATTLTAEISLEES